jgi:myo-inositol-1(or 4)-monophosphatase
MTNDLNLKHIENKLIEWTKLAGNTALALKNKNLSIELKADKSWVTNADTKVNQLLVELIKSEFPTHQILSEELNPDIHSVDYSRPLWTIDPIDGTTNFALGHNYSAISVAFSNNLKVLVGAVYNFLTDEFFHATQHNGAFLNGNIIKPSNNSDLKRSVVLMGQNWKKDPIELYFKQFQNIVSRVGEYRRLGAGAIDICYVACGRADMFFECLNPWDMAAAGLIAKEAGCSISHYNTHVDYDFLPSDLNPYCYLVSNQALHKSFLNLLTSDTLPSDF